MNYRRKYGWWSMVVAAGGGLALLAATGCEGEFPEGDPPGPGTPGTPGTGPTPGGVGEVQSPAFGGGSTDPGIFYRLKSVSSAFCADVEGGATAQADNTRVLQWTCSTGENQQWYLRKIGTADYQLSAKHSAKCLRALNGTLTSGTGLVQDICARSGTDFNGTRFTVTEVGTATPKRYQLNAGNGLCAQSQNTTRGSQVLLRPCGTGTNFLWNLEAVAALPQSDANGRWSQVHPLPSVPAGAALLPNGLVLTWASWKALRFGGADATDVTHTVIFDPNAPTSPRARVVSNTTHNMFCPGTQMMTDGRVFINGGDDRYTETTSIYNYANDSWTRAASMAQRRWYNTSVLLADGRIFTLAGNRTTAQNGSGEIYNPANNTWTFMSGAVTGPITAGGTDANRAMEHPRLLLAPNGKVFVPGPTPNMQWYTLTGTGSVASAGRRGDDEFSQNDVTVMYDVGKIFKAGGNPNYDRPDATITPSSHNSYLIDINGGGTAAVTKVAPMKYPRAFANGVVLPNGQILVVGGLDNGKGFSDDGAIRSPEIFDPVARTWKELAPHSRARPYHSVALLLRDGRVLVGGGGLCASDTCASNHPDVELLSPPYLFGATRPTITSAPTTVTANGGTFTVQVGGAAPVSDFTLVRLSSVTHSTNTDQRFLRLGAGGTGTTRTLTAPANKNIAPPGYYMLFALNGQMPSVAAMVRLN